MIEKHKLEINTDGTKSRILLDETDISQIVSNIKIEREGGKLLKIQIELVGIEVFINGEIETRIEDNRANHIETP